MRRIQWRSVKFNNLLFLSLCAILVVVFSCSKEEPVERPTAKFIIKGKVISADDQTPLENMLVIMMEDTAGIGPVRNARFLTVKDSAYTDQEGNFEVIDSLGIPAEMAYTVLIKEASDELKSADEEITNFFTEKFLAPEFINGDGRWYIGEITSVKTYQFSTKN